MDKIKWISGGILFVCLVFFIAGYSDTLWAAILFGSLAALIYLFVLSVVWLKKIESKVTRTAITSTIILFILLSSFSAILNLQSSTRHTSLLASIHHNIETAYLRANINEPLLNTLRTRYRNNKYQTVSAAFYTNYDSLITLKHEFLYGGNSKEHTWHIYLAKAHADSVVLIGESTYLKGKNSHFLNYSGKTGNYQVEGILTSQGVYYERKN